MLVALTGWGQEEDRTRSKEAGFDAHMVKPVDYDDLLQLLSARPDAGTASSPPGITDASRGSATIRADRPSRRWIPTRRDRR